MANQCESPKTPVCASHLNREFEFDRVPWLPRNDGTGILLDLKRPPNGRFIVLFCQADFQESTKHDMRRG